MGVCQCCGIKGSEEHYVFPCPFGGLMCSDCCEEGPCGDHTQCRTWHLAIENYLIRENDMETRYCQFLGVEIRKSYCRDRCEHGSDVSTTAECYFPGYPDKQFYDYIEKDADEHFKDLQNSRVSPEIFKENIEFIKYTREIKIRFGDDFIDKLNDALSEEDDEISDKKLKEIVLMVRDSPANIKNDDGFSDFLDYMFKICYMSEISKG